MTAPTYPTDAACTDAGHLFFEPDGREDPTVRTRREADARDLCSTCPVAAACLAAAMEHEGLHVSAEYRYGIWGGMTGRERQTLGRSMKSAAERVARRERKDRIARGEAPTGRPGPALAPIAHGTYGGAVAHRRRKVPTCDACHKAERTYRNDYRAARKAAS